MDSSEARDPTRIAARSSMVDSLKGCGLSGVRIDKEDLRRRLSMPQYLRVAVRRAIESKDVSAGAGSAADSLGSDGAIEPPESPMVVFVNSRSGGRHGPALKSRLQQLMGEEQVFDLSNVKPHEFVQYGLGCLDQLASNGDRCARDTRDKLRIMVAGGDGTVGWILGSLGELHKHSRPVPPVAIIPLGTGNDLSRSFGWGGSFPFAWKSGVKRSLHRATAGPLCRLDSWHISVTTPAGGTMELPPALKLSEESSVDQDLEAEGPLPEKVTCYDGIFYNYFSMGMDAQVAYGFHHLRNEKPYLAQGPITNKLIYSGYSCTQGWFFTPCTSDPGLRSLRNILKIRIKKVNCSEWEEILVPSNIRSIVTLNLHNYASGRHPWGSLSPEYLEKELSVLGTASSGSMILGEENRNTRFPGTDSFVFSWNHEPSPYRGFVEAHADDGILEIFGLKHGWHASFVMVELISAKHIAQASAIQFEVRGGEWNQSFMQIDGEPWKQPLNGDYSTFVEIRRVPFQSLMVRGDS